VIAFALDYDETFTADPDFWRQFIALAASFGHTVTCVTCRRETMDNAMQIGGDVPAQVVFTDHGAKKAVCEMKGVHIDVWIDDDPRCIIEGK